MNGCIANSSIRNHPTPRSNLSPIPPLAELRRTGALAILRLSTSSSRWSRYRSIIKEDQNRFASRQEL